MTELEKIFKELNKEGTSEYLGDLIIRADVKIEQFRNCHACTITELGTRNILFVSYTTFVAAFIGGQYYFSKKHYSNTTCCQLTKWTKMRTCERDKGMKDGIYQELFIR